MLPLPTRLRNALRFARGISKAVDRGHSFTRYSRAPMAEAPGGSHHPERRASIPRRLRQEFGWFEHSVHVLPTAGLSEPLRLLHLSDVHVRAPSDWLQALCAELPAYEADLILLTGDIVTRGWSEAAAGAFLDALPQARLGRFAVMGNWEYWGGADPEPWGRFLEAHGVRLLQNEGVDLGPIALAGVDDLLAGEPDPDAALAGLPDDKPTIVMAHSPAIFPALARPPVRLVLSGHSHAGQLRIPLLGAPFLPLGTGPYVGGWFQERGVQLFVSRGIGWSIAPVRLHCPPELAEIRLMPR